MRPIPHECPPPASGGLTYYPARHQGTFPSIRAALAAIGCTGAAADLYVANAAAEASPLVAVPVKPAPAADAPDAACREALALVRRKPGGRADLLIGLPAEARDDEAEAQAVAAELAEAIPGRWFVVAWTRQARAVQ